MPDAEGVLEVGEHDPDNYDPDLKLEKPIPQSAATKASGDRLRALLAQRREK